MENTTKPVTDLKLGDQFYDTENEEWITVREAWHGQPFGVFCIYGTGSTYLHEDDDGERDLEYEPDAEVKVRE